MREEKELAEAIIDKAEQALDETDDIRRRAKIFVELLRDLGVPNEE